MSEVLKEYTYLTGLPEFPPAWTLGYQQSKWGYESQKVVEEVLSNLSINGIPHDVTWLDIDHLNASTPLTMSNEWFYDSKKMFDDAERENRIIIRIADPHMKVDNDFKPYNECAEQDFFVKYQISNFVSECWPGLSSWPDYLRKEVRSWWSSKFTPENGFPNSVFVWNDMNEPSAWSHMEGTFPKDSLQLAEKLESREVKNLYGLAMTAATHDGLVKRGNRTFLLTRSFFAGSQKYTWHWSGDNSGTWSHLQESISTLLNANMNGMYFTGSDMGGFFGSTTAQLLCRWYQAGSLLYPLYREHGELTSNHREPYLYKETNPTEYRSIKESILERYQLLPFLYKTMEKTSRTGEPFVAPSWYYYPNDIPHDVVFQPIVGGDLMVVPVLTNESDEVKVLSPPGRWYNLRTGKELNSKNVTKIESHINESVPAFTRGGSIIGKFSNTSLTVYDTFNNNVTLIISVDELQEAHGYLYFDDLRMGTH